MSLRYSRTRILAAHRAICTPCLVWGVASFFGLVVPVGAQYASSTPWRSEASGVQRDSALVEQIAAALLRDPIESIGLVAADTRVLGAIRMDVDGDGADEAVAWIAPTLRQTPTVLIFRRSTATSPWVRVKEALVPGRLVGVTGRIQDMHVLGKGVDFVAGDGSSETTEQVLRSSAGSPMSLVAYRGFFHADIRDSDPFVVDLTSRTLPGGSVDTCEAFEFSVVTQVAAGRVAGHGDTVFLAALTKLDLTLYRIDAVTTEGRIRKQEWTLSRSPDVLALSTEPDGTLVLVEAGGRTAVTLP